MDSCSATWRAHTHLARGSVFWGERVGSSLMNNNGLINQLLPKSLKGEKRTSRKFQPGAVTNVLTSKNSTELLTKQPPIFERRRADPKNVTSIILGGGAGAELFPLTSNTATPAVSVGGCYKLIDIPMSNCINSGINKVYILTQYNSASLNRHIHRTYYGHGINFGDGFVEVLAATQTPGEAGKQWFQGTADAVRQFMWLFEDARTKDVDNILVLSGDHLYRMDYMEFVQNHIDRNADITVSCVPVGERRASEYGLMKIDSKGQVVQFSEKPKGSGLKSMQADTSIFGLSGKEALEKSYIASMGVYIFKREVLLNLLKNRYPMSNDFGSEIMPAAVKDLNVQAYMFKDYWEDIGTLRTFYEANLALTEERPTFEFYDPKTPFYTSPRFLPPTKMDKCKIKDAIISHGCFLRECTIEHSIIGDRSRLDYGVELKDTMMMGADYYQTEAEIASLLADGKVPMGIGGNSRIRKCIIDKNARVGKDVIITNKDGVEEADRSSEGFYIRSGITIILEKATIPDGTVI